MGRKCEIPFFCIYLGFQTGQSLFVVRSDSSNFSEIGHLQKKIQIFLTSDKVLCVSRASRTRISLSVVLIPPRSEIEQ